MIQVMSVLELTWCIQILFTTNSPADKNNWHPWIFVEKLPDSQGKTKLDNLK